MRAGRQIDEAGDAKGVPVGDLVTRLLAEGRELVALEVARGRALAASRGRTAIRTAALALIAVAFALVALGALAMAAILGLAALGLAAGVAALIVGGVLALGAASAGWGALAAGRRLKAEPERRSDGRAESVEYESTPPLRSDARAASGTRTGEPRPEGGNP